MHEHIKKGFAFFQETHSVENDYVSWKTEWDGDILLNNGSSNSRGTMIAFTKTFEYQQLKYASDSEGRIQLCSILHNDEKLLLINVYNENTEQNQITLLKKLYTLLENFNNILDHEIIMGGDWNFILDNHLDAEGGSKALKLSSISELTKINEKFDLCDIFRLRHPDTRRFSYRQFTRSHTRVQRRLDYFLISSSLQEKVEKASILLSQSSDHSPVFLNFSSNISFSQGRDYWKFNARLLQISDFCLKLIDEIENIKTECINSDPQTRWEMIKYKIRCFSIDYSKNLSKERREKIEILEKTVRDYENLPLSEHNIALESYNNCKSQLDSYTNEKTKGHILRSKVSWHEQGEKNSKFFLNLEKRNGSHNTIKLLASDSQASESETIITDPKEICFKIKNFFTNLFERKSDKSLESCQNFLRNIPLPSVNAMQNEILKKPLSIEELENSIKNSQNGKSPGNDGLTREFYIVFWPNVSQCLFDSLIDGKNKGFLSSSQRQAVIKLLEKKGRDKRYIKNRRPISLINYDTKLLSKVFADRLKTVLPSLISNDQTAYVANRFLGESVRLISDILDITKKLNMDGFLFTIDIEKAFDSVDHTFLFAILEKQGFDPEFIDWIKVLHKNQESTVMNGGTSTGYFPLNRGSRQGDPISAYLFILVIEVFFTMVKLNPEINGIEIFDFKYLLSSYADDTTFFLKNKESAIEILNTFKIFSIYSGLKINKTKCELAGIGAKNGVLEALSDVKTINLNDNTLKILGVHFTYNSKLFIEKNFLEVIQKIENVLALWRWRNLSLIGKITIFKTLAFSKIIFISYLSYVPNSIIEKLEKIKKEFIWNGKRPKVKHSALLGDYEEGGLKDIDIKAKIQSLHLSWVKRLYSQNFHPWKNIPQKLIEFEYKQYIFYSNTSITPPDTFPVFYINLIKAWGNLYQNPITPDTVLCQSIWYNKFILIGNLPIKKLFSMPLFVADLFLPNGLPSPWPLAQEKLNLSKNDHFKWMQIISAIPSTWKKILKETTFQLPSTSPSQHSIQLTRILPIEILSSKQCYILITHNLKAPPPHFPEQNSRITQCPKHRLAFCLPIRK